MRDQILFDQVEEQADTPALSQIWLALSAEVRANVVRLLIALALKLVLSQQHGQASVTSTPAPAYTAMESEVNNYAEL